ncbi:MAG: AprI/Inh family metalloprotease inhibitor [Flavobacteriaceae bacterium]
MNSNLTRWAILGGMALALGACGSSRGLPSLRPSPTPPVSQQPLPPPDYTVPQDDTVQTGEAPPPADGGQYAAVPTTPPPPSAPLEKTDVLGQWTIATTNATCTANIALTSWNGGYRASTRNCADPSLAALGAWNIENNQVVLKDDAGQPIAVMNRTGPTRFDGGFTAGGSVSLVR